MDCEIARDEFNNANKRTDKVMRSNSFVDLLIVIGALRRTEELVAVYLLP